MRQSAARSLWAMAFLTVAASPVLLSVSANTAGTSTRHLADVLGLLAVIMLVCALVLPSRLRSLTRALGVDGMLATHRYLGMVAVALVVAHVVAVIAEDPANLARLDPIHAPNAARAATAATIALGALAGLAVLRRRVRRHYELWRAVHVILAGSVIVLSGLHVLLLDHLIENPSLRAWFVAVSFLLLGVLGYRWVWRRLFQRRGEYVVSGVRAETATVSTLVLEPVWNRHREDARRRLRFAPGQFAWLRLNRSLVVTEEHPFTIASSAQRSGRLEFTVRRVGDFTSTLAVLRPGRRVWLDGPHGAFTVDHHRCSGLVMIAGGVGVTPMMSMLRTLADRGDGRPHRLVVLARTSADLLFRDELAALGGRLNLTVVEVVSRPDSGWSGPTAVDGALLAGLLPGGFRRSQLDYFVCGGPLLVETAVDALASLQIPRARVHTEQFAMV